MMKLLPEDTRLPNCGLQPTQSDEIRHQQNAAVNSELFCRIDYINRALLEVELAKAQLGQREPKIVFVFFFFLLCAKRRFLENHKPQPKLMSQTFSSFWYGTHVLCNLLSPKWNWKVVSYRK